MNKNENIYHIGAAAHEDTVEQRLFLYAAVRQLAFQVKKARTVEDFFRLKESAALYEAQAEELFASWDIPKSYLVHGGSNDLDGIREKELLDYGADDPCGDNGEPEDGGGLEDEGEDFEAEAFLELLADMAAKAHFLAETLDILLAISEDGDE